MITAARFLTLCVAKARQSKLFGEDKIPERQMCKKNCATIEAMTELFELEINIRLNGTVNSQQST